jgi:radical SAM-linked protein
LKARIKFRKQGCMKFIGHLDIMRYFQKSIRRAGIDIAYTAGYSPHMIMSFASPLGVGLTSDGEYFDIEVGSCISSAHMIKRLNEVMVEGMEVVSFRQIEEGKASNAMSIVAAADYTVTFKPNYIPVVDWEKQIIDFYNQEQIIILKKTKKSEKEIDMKPLIYELNCENGIIFMKLATGSVNNLKPELVVEAFLRYLDIELSEDVVPIAVNRVEVYANTSNQNGGLNFISLEDMGEEIG